MRRTTIQAWESVWNMPDKFLIRIRADFYAMSADAATPSGCCIYLGREPRWQSNASPLKLTCLPAGVIRKIESLLSQEGIRWVINGFRARDQRRKH